MTSIFDYIVRGGEHPNLQREGIEQQIAQMALQKFISSPKSQEKGLKHTYNLLFFQTLYCTRDPHLTKFLYDVMPYPEYLEVEVTTACDMKCHLCEHTHWKEKAKNMSFPQFKNLISQFPNLKWIGMTGIGQSWLNKDYMRMMQYIKDKGVYIENFDNFKWITPDISKEMIDMGLDKLYVSLDAATEETYNKVQPGAEWSQVIANIKAFDAYKKSKNLFWPELWFHFIVTKENIHEMEDYLDFLHSLDVEIEGVQFTKMLHDFKEVEDQHVEISDEKKAAVFEKAKRLGLNTYFNMNSVKEEEKVPQSGCTLWTQPFVFADGTMIACCSMNEQNDRPWQVKTSPGNAFKGGVRKTWEEGFRKMTTELNKGEVPKNCERCVLFKKNK